MTYFGAEFVKFHSKLIRIAIEMPQNIHSLTIYMKGVAFLSTLRIEANNDQVMHVCMSYC